METISKDSIRNAMEYFSDKAQFDKMYGQANEARTMNAYHRAIDKFLFELIYEDADEDSAMSEASEEYARAISCLI